MAIRYILICSSRSTAKTSFLFVRSVRSQELTNCCSLPLHHTFASTNPGEWPLGTNTPMNGHGPWMLMMQDCSKRIQKICYLPHPDHHWSPVNGSLWRFFFSNPFYHPLRHGMHSAIGILESFWWPRLSRFAAESVYLGDPTYRNGTDRKTLPIIYIIYIYILFFEDCII